MISNKLPRSAFVSQFIKSLQLLANLELEAVVEICYGHARDGITTGHGNNKAYTMVSNMMTKKKRAGNIVL